MKIMPTITPKLIQNDAALRNSVAYALELASEQINKRGSILKNQFEGNRTPLSWGPDASAGRGWRE
jgi:hypothetical protein